MLTNGPTTTLDGTLFGLNGSDEGEQESEAYFRGIASTKVVAFDNQKIQSSKI